MQRASRHNASIRAKILEITLETQAHHSVWETAEVLDHHLSQHVGVSHHHNWFTAQIVPETRGKLKF